jgi:hypothetical protein
MARTKQTARKSIGGKTARRQRGVQAPKNPQDLTYQQIQEYKKTYVPPPKVKKQDRISI